MVKKSWFVAGILILAGIFLIAAGFQKDRIKAKYFDLIRPKDEIPTAVKKEELQASVLARADLENNGTDNESADNFDIESSKKVEEFKKKTENEIASKNLPPAFNLDIPFASQAPHGNWNLPYQEACEEASMLMASNFLLDKGGFARDIVDREILKLIQFESDNSYAIDMTAKETAEVIEKYYGLRTELKYEFEIKDIKLEIYKGNVVILPFAGRMLQNPYYTPPGPLYHMMVIKGYTEKVFITNDPGTVSKGKDFQFSYDNIINSNHDWNGGDVKNGRKVMIVVSK